MDYDSFLELIKNRRSIRRFKPDPVPEEYVDKIIEAARWAPSGANSQPWEFIVIKDKKLRDRIVELHGEHDALAYRMEQTRPPEDRMPRFAQPSKFPPSFAVAPVFILMLGDPRTREAYPMSSVADLGGSIFNSSLASAFLYMHLAATTLGLGTRWLSVSSNSFMQCFIKPLLGIPKELEIYDMIVVGYPDMRPEPRLVRPKEEMVHYDYYDMKKFRTDKDIREFINATRGIVKLQP